MILLAALALSASSLNCIAYVHDGDTVKRCDGQRLRIANIDAPEVKGSPSCRAKKRESHWCDYRKGQKATVALETMLATGTPSIIYSGRQDRYRRPLVTIRVNGQDVGEALIAKGLARRW